MIDPETLHGIRKFIATASVEQLEQTKKRLQAAIDAGRLQPRDGQYLIGCVEEETALRESFS